MPRLTTWTIFCAVALPMWTMWSPASVQNKHRAAPVKVVVPELSGTFRTLPPEPTPTRARTLRNPRSRLRAEEGVASSLKKKRSPEQVNVRVSGKANEQKIRKRSFADASGLNPCLFSQYNMYHAKVVRFRSRLSVRNRPGAT